MVSPVRVRFREWNGFGWGGLTERAAWFERLRGAYTLGWPVGATPPGMGVSRPRRYSTMKKVLGIVALLGAVVGVILFWRRRQEDDEFLDEELD
jgi:hypothetical protein